MKNFRHKILTGPGTAAELKPSGPKGLGDLIEIVAQPIAHGIDAVLGTDVKNCGGCGKRKAALNEMVPFKK